jgi:hypothetical protein
MFAITMLINQKIVDAPNKNAREIRQISKNAKFISDGMDGNYYQHPEGWVNQWKGKQKALTATPIIPPIDPPPAVTEEWGIVNVSTDTTERTNDPATRPLTNANPPKANSTKGTPIWILGWETYVKLINVLSSWAWLLKPLTMWINRYEMRAEQLCGSCNIIHIVNSNATHYQIETLYNTANVSRFDPYEYNWLFKPWLFHQALMRNGRTGGIFLVAGGKYVYFPLLRTESAPMWIRKEYVELLPTTMTDGRQITSFRFFGASIYGMVDGEEITLRAYPRRDEFWQDPAWPLVTQGCIPPA